MPPLAWIQVEGTLRYSYVGEADDVVAGLEELVAATGANELMTVTYAFDPEVRRESIAALGEAWHR